MLKIFNRSFYSLKLELERLADNIYNTRMQKFTVITIGRIKTSFWQEAAQHYRLRLQKCSRFKEIQLRDAAANLKPEDKIRQEGERIIAALPPGQARICLDEHGDLLSSVELAQYIKKLALQSRPPCFIIGGAYGLAPTVLKQADKIISFGRVTFPHELAQVLLWEQLFRADSILRKTGYHHE